MARISTYNIDQKVVAEDKWIGTDSNGAITKNFSAQGVANFLNEASAIAIAGQNNFFFQTDLSNGRSDGTISFTNGGGANTAFNVLTTIKFSKYSSAGTMILNYLQTLIGRDVFIVQTDNTNNFGVYKLLSFTQDILAPNFYDATFQLVGSNGALLLNKFYAFAIYPELPIPDKNYVFTQNTPSTLWQINHNLNKRPSVTAVNVNNIVVYGDVTYIDDNNLTIQFNAGFSGKAYLN